MISVLQVQMALRPVLGTSLVSDPGFGRRVAAILQGWFPGRLSLEETAAQVEDALFNELYERLGPSMTLRAEDGSSHRIRMADLPDLADECMGVLFDSLRVTPAHYDLLHAYCMKSGSFAGLRTLYLHFQEQTPPGERKIIARILRDNYPAARWQSWLNPADC